MINRYWPFSILALLLSLAAGAQVMMQVSTERDNYLTYEAILMKVVLRNNSGNHLNFGSGGDNHGYLRLELTDRYGRRIEANTQQLNAASGLVLPSGGSKSVTINLNNFFTLNKPGFYEVRARLGHSRFNHDILSQVIRVKVNDGQVFWERDVGIPGKTQDDPIQHRNVAILTFQADGSQIYALRIQDERYVYSVIRLAPRVRGIKPQVEVDARSHVHFFVQTQPRLFSYWVFDYNGKEKMNAHYIVEEYLPIPRMIRDPDIGRVMVAGGRRAQEGVDFNEVTLPVMEVQELPPPEEVKEAPISSLDKDKE